MRNDELQAAVFRFEKRVKAGNQSLKKGKANGIPMGRAEIEFHKDMTLALTALRDVLQRQLDPDTGLVPCGCGGKAKIESGSIRCIKCDISVRCGHDDYINHHDDAKFFYEIREPWNRAMGWRVVRNDT